MGVEAVLGYPKHKLASLPMPSSLLWKRLCQSLLFHDPKSEFIDQKLEVGILPNEVFQHTRLCFDLEEVIRNIVASLLVLKRSVFLQIIEELHLHSEALHHL